MTLTTHGIAGALISGALIHQPLIGLPLAFASHFLLDAFPHRDYKILSLDESAAGSGVIVMNRGRNFTLDLMRIGFDGLLGLLIIWGLNSVVSPGSLYIVVLGGILGMAPDALQFVYGKYRFKFLAPIQSFHSHIHTDIRFKNSLLWGVGSQLLLVLVMSFFWWWYF